MIAFMKIIFTLIYHYLFFESLYYISILDISCLVASSRYPEFSQYIDTAIQKANFEKSPIISANLVAVIKLKLILDRQKNHLLWDRTIECLQNPLFVIEPYIDAVKQVYFEVSLSSRIKCVFFCY